MMFLGYGVASLFAASIGYGAVKLFGNNPSGDPEKSGSDGMSFPEVEGVKHSRSSSDSSSSGSSSVEGTTHSRPSSSSSTSSSSGSSDAATNGWDFGTAALDTASNADLPTQLIRLAGEIWGK